MPTLKRRLAQVVERVSSAHVVHPAEARKVERPALARTAGRAITANTAGHFPDLVEIDCIIYRGAGGRSAEGQRP
jgi:hypothetical protein